MIVFTDAYLLSQQQAGTPLSRPRIGYATFTRSLSVSAVTASTTAAGSAADSPLRPDTYEFWKPTAVPATWAVDLGTAQNVDYVGIAGHTIGTCGVTVKAQYSTDNINWTDFVTQLAPADNSPIMFLGTSVFARYWRIYLSGGSAMPQISVVYVGTALAIERGIVGGYKPITLNRETVLKRQLSRGGRFLGQAYQRNGVSGEAAFAGLTPSWYRTYFDPFVKSARRFPFFFAWLPDAYPQEIVYAWATNDIHPGYMGLNPFMEVSFQMQGIGYGD